MFFPTLAERSGQAAGVQTMFLYAPKNPVSPGPPASSSVYESIGARLYQMTVAPVVGCANIAYQYVGSRLWYYRLFTILDAEFPWMAAMVINSLAHPPQSPIAGQHFHYFMLTPVAWALSTKVWAACQNR